MWVEFLFTRPIPALIYFQGLTHALFYLAANPEYVQPMREEVEAVIEAEGWTKLSMGKMRKVDSFIKESQRLSIGAGELVACLRLRVFVDDHTTLVIMRRKVVKDFTFSNGVTLPAGTHLAVATYATHMDPVSHAGLILSHINSHPTLFRRRKSTIILINLKGSDSQKCGRKKERTSNIKSYLSVPTTWCLELGVMLGISSFPSTFCRRSAELFLFLNSPGRFFAANELKAMLAYILLNYDVKLPNDGLRPQNQWFMGNSSPNRTAEIMFRRRQAWIGARICF